MNKDKSKRRKTPIAVSILFVILVVLYFILSTSSCGRGGSAPAEVPAVTEAAETPAEVNETEAHVTAAPAETTVPEAPPEPVILEDEGELEIIIPEGMDSEGF